MTEAQAKMASDDAHSQLHDNVKRNNHSSESAMNVQAKPTA